MKKIYILLFSLYLFSCSPTREVNAIERSPSSIEEVERIPTPQEWRDERKLFVTEQRAILDQKIKANDSQKSQGEIWSLVGAIVGWGGSIVGILMPDDNKIPTITSATVGLASTIRLLTANNNQFEKNTSCIRKFTSALRVFEARWTVFSYPTSFEEVKEYEKDKRMLDIDDCT